MLICKKHCPRLARHSTFSERCWNLRLYPNPARDYITVEYRTADVSTGKLWLLITDVSGRKLREIALKGGDYDELIDISSLIPGVYTVSIRNERVILSTQKLTVIK